MRVTIEEIMDKRTKRAKRSNVGAWSKKQLAEWGVPWPPVKGWKSRLVAGQEQATAEPRKKTGVLWDDDVPWE